MIRRIQVLTTYLLKQFLRSISGILYILSVIAFWLVLFNPTSGRVPESDYFILLVGLYGFVLALMMTLSFSSLANRLESAAMIARLPSRIEYLTAVLIATLVVALTLQAGLSIVILLQPNGPDLGFTTILNIPPIWIAANIFAVVLALHASDFVMSGWSRVWVFGILALLLFSQSIDARGTRWIVNRLTGIANFALNWQLTGISQSFRNAANWVSVNGLDFLAHTVGFVFWPFRAIAQAVRNGFFDQAQALAPAIILLYATILFLLAADLFARKDLSLSE